MTDYYHPACCLSKQNVDEIIFRKTNLRNRLILKLMARGGMRIGQLFKLIIKKYTTAKGIKKRSLE